MPSAGRCPVSCDSPAGHPGWGDMQVYKAVLAREQDGIRQTGGCGGHECSKFQQWNCWGLSGHQMPSSCSLPGSTRGSPALLT